MGLCDLRLNSNTSKSLCSGAGCSSKSQLSSLSDHMIVLGGLCPAFTSSVESWNPRQNKWAPLLDLPFKEFVYGDAAPIGQWVIVVGEGLNPETIHAQSLCINTITGEKKTDL